MLITLQPVSALSCRLDSILDSTAHPSISFILFGLADREPQALEIGLPFRVWLCHLSIDVIVDGEEWEIHLETCPSVLMQLA